MQWYYSNDTTQFGPVEQAELIAKIVGGEITADDRVWREGMADWLACGRIPELWPGVPPASAAVRNPPAGQSTSPYAPPQAAAVSWPQGGSATSSGKATASLVLGIIATVTGVASVMCCGVWMLGVPCGILAVVFGNQVQRAALTDVTLAAELGKAKAGIITGWIGLGLAGLWLLFFGGVMMIGRFA